MYHYDRRNSSCESQSGGVLMGYSVNTTTNRLIALIVFIAVVVGFAPTVLVYFGNISTSGILLAGTIATLMGILFGIYVLKGGMKMLG